MRYIAIPTINLNTGGTTHAIVKDKSGTITIQGRAVEIITDGPEPTDQQILAALQEQRSKNLAAEQLSAELLTHFQSLPIGVQAFFDPVRVAVNARMKAGELSLAKEIIQTIPVPPELESTRSALLALFQ